MRNANEHEMRNMRNACAELAEERMNLPVLKLR